MQFSLHRLLFIVLPMAVYCNVHAQPSFPPPSGVYCSCGPTTGIGAGSVDPAVAAKPFVKGILVRVGWNYLETSDNTYNWALIDSQLSAARSYSKKVSLGIGCGIQIPQWVFTVGAQRLVTTVPIADTIAVPWDSVFLHKWTEFITALGNRYKNDTTIQLVYMTNSTANGFEMQMPFVSNPTLAAVGYTSAKMTNSWKMVIDTFNAAFPNHYLSNDFHPVNNSDSVADSVYAYAIAKVGSRYGANAWWWTQHNTAVYPAEYTILQNSAVNNDFTGIQMAYSGTSDSASFGAGGMPAALQLAIGQGVCYWELWNQDILNAAFDSLLSHASCSPATSIGNTATAVAEIKIYPNPSDGVFYIVPTSGSENKTGELKVYNTLGQMVLNEQLSFTNGAYKVYLPGCADGLYFIQVISKGAGIYMDKILVRR